MTNYGYVAEHDPSVTDDYLDHLRVVIERWPDIKVLREPTILPNLRAFLQEMAADTAGHPVEDIVACAHGWRNLWQIHIDIAVDDILENGCTWETLDRTEDPANHASIDIPPRILGTSPTGAVIGPHVFHARGCSIGQQPKYLKKIYQALGSHLPVTAPKHFHAASHRGDDYYEWMAYEFFIFSKERIGTGRDLAKAFADRGTDTLVDDLSVPDAMWGQWLRRFAKLGSKLPLSGKKKQNSPLGRRFGAWATVETDTRLKTGYETRVECVLDYTSAGAIPSLSDQMDDVRKMLREGPDQGFDDYQDYHPGHEFPQHERLGYPTFDAMIDGLKWLPTPDGLIVTMSGGRWEYELMVPITRPTGTLRSLDPRYGTLVFNHHPPPGAPLAQPHAILETDDHYYGRWP